MNFPRFFVLCVFHTVCYFALVAEVKSSPQALIFNHGTQKLQQQNGQDEKEKCESCLTACPAISESQKVIDERVSISGSGIYIYSIHENKYVHLIETDICKEPYKPTMLFNTSSNLYETGYEFFYDVELPGLKCGKYDQFHRVFNHHRTNSKPFLDEEAIKVQRIGVEENTKFEVITSSPVSNLKWRFYWISVLSIYASQYQRQITFAGDTINNYHHSVTMPTCKDFNLGDEIHKVTPHPSLQGTQTNDNDSLEEIQIMPMRYFHTLSAKLATCIFLNIAYLWKPIANGQYKTIDLYLYSIYKLWPSRINIIFGVADTAPEISITRLIEINPNSRVFQTFPIPVPGTIYRIIEYSFNDLIYNAIVVLHNTFESVPKDKRICDEELELVSWNKIKTQQYGKTYVCTVTKQAIQRLGARYEISPMMRNFELSLFPKQDETTGKILNDEDVRDEIQKQVDENIGLSE